MAVESGTWHHGLMARWWAEFVSTAEPEKLDYFRAAIRKFGEPALDLAEGERRKTADGDELESISRLLNFDPLEQVYESQVRMRLWSNGKVVKEEEYSLKENLYFAQEMLLLLEEAGFGDITVEGSYSGRPAVPDESDGRLRGA